MFRVVSPGVLITASTETATIMPDTVDAVVWAPDNGWRYHPKHVEQFAITNKLYIVTSFWIIIDTYYGDARTIEHKNTFYYSI